MSALSPRSRAILEMLADGAFHSGEQLAANLGVSRAAVWKHVRDLGPLGLEVFRVPGRGYRLAAPLELLSAERIRADLPSGCREHLKTLTVLDQVDSTNTWLATQSAALPAACLAEFQTAGRGRRGRQWFSPFGANLYLSLAWQFEDLPPGFTALGMTTAVAAVKALARFGIGGVAVKWPNDLIAGGRKLGGILVDMQGEPPARARAVIGVGINVRMPETGPEQIDQPWVDIATLTGPAAPGRNALAAALIAELMAALELFAARGFPAFAADWRALDLAAGHTVSLHHQEQIIIGTALGVDDDGALLLRVGGDTRRFVSGDISLRMRA